MIPVVKGGPFACFFVVVVILPSSFEKNNSKAGDKWWNA
jgi:hypothetical protein